MGYSPFKQKNWAGLSNISNHIYIEADREAVDYGITSLILDLYHGKQSYLTKVNKNISVNSSHYFIIYKYWIKSKK